MSSTFSGPGKRNAAIFSGLQALGGANPALVVALGGIVGQQLVTNPEYATIPVSLFNLGMALGILPAAFFMRKIGRRNAYFIGSFLGILGGLTAYFGISSQSFVIFCLGTIFAGLYSSYVQNYRFAAADSVAPEWRPKAISWVMLGGLVAAVLATQLIMHTQDLIPELPFSATFLAQAALAACAIPLIFLVRADAIHHTPPPETEATAAHAGRPLLQIVKNPRFIVALITGMVSYSLMSFMMTAAPLAMIDIGYSVRDSTLGIQWHILAMFSPSFFTSILIKRFGKITITLSGIVLIGAAGVVAIAGLSVGHFWLSLILLGVGWNFSFIGATTLVTDCYRAEETGRVQAFNDFFVFGSVAISSFSSGQMLALYGWNGLNLLTFPIIGVVIVALIWLWIVEKKNPHPSH